jgi:hypothetical protein
MYFTEHVECLIKRELCGWTHTDVGVHFPFMFQDYNQNPITCCIADAEVGYTYKSSLRRIGIFAYTGDMTFYLQESIPDP